MAPADSRGSIPGVNVPARHQQIPTRSESIDDPVEVALRLAVALVVGKARPAAVLVALERQPVDADGASRLLVIVGAVAQHEAPPDVEVAVEPEPLIERIQQTLGMAIMVESVEPAEPGATDEPSGPTTIRAALMYAQHTTEVSVTADTEAKAWEELARVATAWRNLDRQHIQMWPGAGG